MNISRASPGDQDRNNQNCSAMCVSSDSCQCDSSQSSSSTMSFSSSSQSSLVSKQIHRRVRVACAPCATSKLKCDTGRPCSTCVRRNIDAIHCVDRVIESNSFFEEMNRVQRPRQLVFGQRVSKFGNKVVIPSPSLPNDSSYHHHHHHHHPRQ